MLHVAPLTGCKKWAHAEAVSVGCSGPHVRGKAKRAWWSSPAVHRQTHGGHHQARGAPACEAGVQAQQLLAACGGKRVGGLSSMHGRWDGRGHLDEG